MGSQSATVGLELDVLLEAYQSLYFLGFARVGYVCFLAYDIALCFPTELEYIWYTQWSRGKLLYIVYRYFTLFYFAAIALTAQFLVNCSLEESKSLSNLVFWGGVFINAVVQILVGIRTFALYHGSRIIKWTIIVLFIVNSLVSICMGVLFSNSGTYVDALLRGTPCALQVQELPTVSLVAALLACAAYDAVLWAILLVKLYQAYVEGQRRLIGVIFKLGLLYFTFVSVMNVVCAILYMTAPQSKLLTSSGVAHFVQAMGSVLSARFILQLRTYVGDSTMQSISVPPEQVMRIEDEMKFGHGGTTTTRTDEVFGTL